MNDFEYNNEVIEHCPVEMIVESMYEHVELLEDMEGHWYE